VNRAPSAGGDEPLEIMQTQVDTLSPHPIPSAVIYLFETAFPPSIFGGSMLQ